MKLTKEKTYGYIGSVLFCILLLFILWFSVLRTIIPSEEEGILVNFGNIDEASGMFEPQSTGNNTNEIPVEPSVPENPTPPTPAPQQIAITQNIEQTAIIDAENKRKEEERKQQEKLRREQEEKRRQEEAERKRIEEEKKRQQAINNQVAGAFGAGSSQSTSQGTGTGTGNQGSPQGNSEQGANSGAGGYGDFSLTGRSLGPGGLPRPSYSIQEEGVVVIDITVDRNGNVILATIGQGTNLSNATLRQSALDAAKKAKFNSISRNENQSGRITYKFYLR